MIKDRALVSLEAAMATLYCCIMTKFCSAQIRHHWLNIIVAKQQVSVQIYFVFCTSVINIKVVEKCDSAYWDVYNKKAAPSSLVLEVLVLSSLTWTCKDLLQACSPEEKWQKPPNNKQHV